MRDINNTRGFTLIELIATIALLTIIGLIAIPTVNTVIKDAEADSEAISYEMIEKAASAVHSTYGPGNEFSDVPGGGYTVQTLIDNGFLSYKDNLPPEVVDGVVHLSETNGFTYGNRNYMRNSDKLVEGRGSRSEHIYYGKIDDALEDIGEGETITISFDVKMGTGDYLQMYNNNHRGQWFFHPLKSWTNIGTDWTRLSFTTEVWYKPSHPKATTDIEFYGKYDTGNVPAVKNIKIEKGSVATPWVPALED